MKSKYTSCSKCQLKTCIKKIVEGHPSYLALLRSPLPIRIAVVDELIRPGITDLGGRVADDTLGLPLDVVAGRFRHQERLGAPRVPIAVFAFLHGEIEHAAFGDAGCCRKSQSGGLITFLPSTSEERKKPTVC